MESANGNISAMTVWCLLLERKSRDNLRYTLTKEFLELIDACRESEDDDVHEE